MLTRYLYILIHLSLSRSWLSWNSSDWWPEPNAFQLYKDENSRHTHSYQSLVFVSCQEIIFKPLLVPFNFWLQIFIFMLPLHFCTAKAIKRNVLLVCLNSPFITRHWINARYSYTKLQFSSLKLLVVYNKVFCSNPSSSKVMPGAKQICALVGFIITLFKKLFNVHW